MAAPEMHALLQPLAWLLGEWKGSGRGHYPSIDDFSYEEEIRFWHGGKPVMAYSSRTWSPATGKAMHTEMGYWRPREDGIVEVVLAHSFGLTEIMEGHAIDNRVELSSLSFGATPTAKRVDAESRVLELRDGALHYEMAMAYGGNELQNHLSGQLTHAG